MIEPIQLIDTHAHLDADAFAKDLDEVIDRAASVGVVQILTIGINLETSRNAYRLAERFPDVFAVVGIQPNYVSTAKPSDLDEIAEMCASPNVVGIGETGLDRYWDYAPIDLQREYFRKHLELSATMNLPFVVHCREAEDDVVEELQSFAGGKSLQGLMHSFCGNQQTADACLELGLHFSFSGMLTYKKNRELREVAASIPRDRLLIETDAPYLVPTPKRGKEKRNEPAYVMHTCEVLAETHGTSLREMAEQTTGNTRSLFILPAM